MNLGSAHRPCPALEIAYLPLTNAQWVDAVFHVPESFTQVSLQKFLLDRRPRDGDIHSIQVSDGADHEHPENQEPADFTANDVHGETQVNDCKSTRKFWV